MSRYKGVLVLIIIFVGIITLALTATCAIAAEGCTTCHAGIKKISDTPTMAALTCTDCHMGDAEATEMGAAHTGMFANPSDFRVIDQTCGGCHPEEVSNNKKSLHSTMAGMISGTRYLWAAQKTKGAIYATYDIEDTDGSVPEKRGAVRSLKQLPTYDPKKKESSTNSPADDYLRNQCLRCHLWSSGHERDGDYRASGCAACHIPYSDAGTYEGKDKAIDKSQKDRPRLHRITTIIPVEQCLHCHNRSGQTGVSYIGTMESDGYGSPWSGEPGKKGGKKLHGKYYNHLTGDVHYERGMLCIDCHTKADLHGDGNIYQKREQAVEVECTDCHGTSERYSILMTGRGTKLENLSNNGNKFLLTSKSDGKKRSIKQTKDIVVYGDTMARTAMGIKSHQQKLECYACHARWAPQCYGCHAQQDASKPNSDWISTGSPADISKSGTKANRSKSAYSWKETRSYLRWETPTLGINTEGLVSPFIPGCQVIFTQIGPDGKPREVGKIYKTADKTSGLAHNPIQPHTISRKTRDCEDCHASTKAVGLGSNFHDAKANGVDVPFGMDQIVTRKGKQLQATTHEGARPFNKDEIDKILKVDLCISCHDAQLDTELWRKITDVTGFASTNQKHRKILEMILKQSTKGK